MKKSERILIAGSGAVVPMVTGFLVVDVSHVAEYLSIGLIIGYMLRALALFTLGAISGLINSNIRDRATLFQIGISAPAVIGGIIMTFQPSHIDPPTASTYAAPIAKVAYMHKTIKNDDKPYTDTQTMPIGDSLITYQKTENGFVENIFSGFLGRYQ